MKEQAAAARAPAVSDVAVGTEAELEAAPPAPQRTGCLIEDTVVPNLISKERAEQYARIQRAIEDNLRKEREQEAFRAFLRGKLDGEER